MDTISDKFENWPDRIINLRVTFTGLLKKPLFDFDISINHCFQQIYLKLADMVDMNEISNYFENWPDRIISLRVASS